MTDEQIKHMASRFLAWDLPEDFHPDAGINFEPVGNAGTAYEYRYNPIGTNLFTATQAEAMVRHMVEGLATPEMTTEEREQIVRETLEAAKAALPKEGRTPWSWGEKYVLENCHAAIDALMPKPVGSAEALVEKYEQAYTDTSKVNHAVRIGFARWLLANPNKLPNHEKVLSYDWAHEDAQNMGYPSLTEALEHLDELRENATVAGAKLMDDLADRIAALSAERGKVERESALQTPSWDYEQAEAFFSAPTFIKNGEHRKGTDDANHD